MSRNPRRDGTYKRWESGCPGIPSTRYRKGEDTVQIQVKTGFHSFFFQDRKQIVKVLKPHIERICLDDDAQLVLFTALDVIEYVLYLWFYIIWSNTDYQQ